METLMVDCVQSSLRLFMHRNAIFLCERLCAEFPTELNLQLLATCYLRNNQAYSAYQLLKGTQMAQSRYLFALSCFQMNLLREAETALCPANESNAEIPNGAAGHYLLGLIYRYTDRRANAVHHFMQALEIDPLLWSAYEELCILGAADETHEYFNDSASHRIMLQHQFEHISQNLQCVSSDCNAAATKILSSSVDFSPRQSKQLHPNNLKENPCHPHAVHPINCSSHSNMSLYNTPSPTHMQLSGIVPPPICRNTHQTLNAASDCTTRSNVNNAIQAPRRKFMDEGKLRKVSGRLFSDSGPRRSTRLSGEGSTTGSSNVSQIGGNGANHSSLKFLSGFSSSKMSTGTFRSVTLSKGQSCNLENLEEDAAETSTSVSTLLDAKSLDQQKVTPLTGNNLSHISRMTSGILELLSLLRILGEGFRLSCNYRCRDALEIYLRLPSKQYNTGWVLSQVGKAHFELVDYLEADHAFSLACRVSPYMLEGMDVYSTVLYHLKEEMKLSYLAQELILIDRLSPQAWCAMGNCYSLQKDHETALKNFHRAVHLDSRFVYAHTLCGHEYIALEDFENGIKCYQNALQVDERHYNAWYGLGVVYLRHEKFEFAVHHFRKALHINPFSSVLMCYLSMALHPLKRNDEALMIIEKAILADKKNPLPIYQKSIILISLERYDEALEELLQLKENAPRESSIYALIGKIYKRQNIHDKAMFYFGLALDLNPPTTDVAAIKAAVEKLYLPDEMEDVAV